MEMHGNQCIISREFLKIFRTMVKAYLRDKKKEEIKRGSVQSNLRMFESTKLGQSVPKEENEAHSNPVAYAKFILIIF